MIAQTFLFVEFLDENGCMSLRLMPDGSVSDELGYRTFEDIKAIQGASPLMVVVPALMSGLYQVELPWLSDSKARAAIPYALEEQLAQKIPALHFAFDKAHHQHNRYLVAVIDKMWLTNLTARLDEAGLVFHEITLDWFALHSGEICVTSNAIFIDNERYQGALSFDVASGYLSQLTDHQSVLTFSDSATDLRLSGTPIDHPFLLWAAQRLQSAAHINFCQGEFRRTQEQEGFSRRWLLMGLGTVGAWALTVLSMNMIDVMRLNHQNHVLDQAIAVVYRQFFPQAQQVISPRFRISQLLGSGQMTQDTSVMWLLLDNLNQAINTHETTVESFSYRNKTLSVALRGKEFKAFDGLSERLKQAHLKVAQTQALSHEHDVTTVLELRL